MEDRALADILVSHFPRFESVDGPVRGCTCGFELKIGDLWSDHVVRLVSADQQVDAELSSLVQQLRARGEIRAAEIVRTRLMYRIRDRRQVVPLSE